MDTSSLMKLASNPQVRQLITSLLGSMGGGGGKGNGGKSNGGAKLAGLVDNLDKSGLHDQVTSWVGTGDNAPITPGQITKAIGPERIDQAAKAAGMTPQAASDALAKVLPEVVDKATPAGTPPTAGSFDTILSQLFGK